MVQSAIRIGFLKSGTLSGIVLALRDYLEMAQTSLLVIPAKAGIQVFRRVMDPGLRRGDGVSEF
jgi:hypothetical protein